MVELDSVTPELQQLAHEAYEWFETATRGDDPEKTYLRLKDDSPEWVKVLVREAHGEFLPDDWRYDTIRSALAAIHDAAEGEDLGDVSSEFADDNVDADNGARVAWLASNMNRGAIVDDACWESSFTFTSVSGVFDAIGLGQYEESRVTFESVRRSLCERLDEIEDGDDEGEEA